MLPDGVFCISLILKANTKVNGEKNKIVYLISA
jgi:hypothetical protein